MRNPPLCTLRELQDGTYNICDLADMHEAMDAEDEYARRAEKARERNK